MSFMKLNSKTDSSHRSNTLPSATLSKKLSTAVKTGDMQTAKVAQIMLELDSGNDKLNEAMKQLANVRAWKEKLQGKLMKTQNTLRLVSMTFPQKDLNTSNLDAVRVHRQILTQYCFAPGIGDPARVRQICQFSQRNVTRYFLRCGCCNILQCICVCCVELVLKNVLKFVLFWCLKIFFRVGGLP